MFRRHLGYTPAEVDAMPWWEKQMFTECINQEFQSSGDTDEPRIAKVSDDASNLSSLGLNIQTF